MIEKAEKIREDLHMGRIPYDSILARKVYVRELGSSKLCARRHCGRSPRWRIIHGRWNMQSWICRQHLPWGLELEQLTSSRGEALGWEHGYPALSEVTGKAVSFTLKTPMVTPTMGQITQYGGHGGRVLDYARDVSDEIIVTPPAFV